MRVRHFVFFGILDIDFGSATVGCRSVNGAWPAPERVAAGLKWL